MEWTFPISPIAASRPRVSRHGAYFAGPYKEFRKTMQELVPEVIGDGFFPYDIPLSVDVEIYVGRPKKTKLSAPRADIDNYLKAIFDSLNGWLWEDDKLIHEVYATKQWACAGEQGYFTIGVSEYVRNKNNK
jgi:Holliday junction resolvase RusA-like endonuclease